MEWFVEVTSILKRLCDLKKIEIIKDLKRIRPSDNIILQCDSKKFRKKSGWKPEILFDKTLKDKIEKAADRFNVSKSELIKQAIEKYFSHCSLRKYLCNTEILLRQINLT